MQHIEKASKEIKRSTDNNLSRNGCSVGQHVYKQVPRNQIFIYFMADFNYCLLLWVLFSASSLKKIENLQKGAPRFLCNDYEILYEELLTKSVTFSMNTKRLRALYVELYKTITK